MRTLALGLAAALSFAGVGCVHFQPVGPLADAAPPPSRPAPGVKVTAPKDAPQMPVVQPAPAPPPPALLVTPAEVTDANYRESARRLVEEMEADRKAMEAMPRPAEISVIKR